MTTGLGDIAGLMQGASSLMSNLPQIMALIEKIFYFSICLFFGGLVMHGWKKYKNWGVKLIGSMAFGIICLAGGVLFSQVIPMQLPFLEGVLQAFLTAVILYFILWLISGDHKELGKFITKEQFLELRKGLEKLSSDFKKLKAMLERKKIMPEKLSSKELENILKEFLESKNIKKYGLAAKDRKGEVACFTVKDEKLDEYKVGFDFYTGENVSFIQVNMTYAQKIKKALRTLARNDRMLAGVIIGIVFSVFMLLLINESSIQEITDKLAITSTAGIFQTQAQTVFAGYAVNNTSCLTVIDLLYIVNTGLYTDVAEGAEAPQSIENEIKELYPNEELMSSLSQYTYGGIDYLLALSTTLTDTEFGNAMQNYLMQNPMALLQGGIDFCALKHNGKTIDKYIHVCSANINESTVCGCELLMDISDYCFVFSELISNQITSQLSQLGGEGGDLSGLLGGMLGGLQ